MPRKKSRTLLIVLSSSLALTIGTAMAIAQRPATAESRVSSKELLEAAHAAYEVNMMLYKRAAGDVTTEDLYNWSKRWMTAERDFNPGAAEAVKAAKAHLQRMAELAEIANARHQAARGTGGDVAATKYYQIEAELMVPQVGK